MLFKKGAMFGLDARIALAILGALSVISGAALFSAIEKAKVQQLLSVFTETTKSVEAYLLDVGTIMPRHASTMFDPASLVTSTLSSWKGPYLTNQLANYGSHVNGGFFIGFSTYDGSKAVGHITSYKHDDSSIYTSKISYCTTGDECTIWIGINELSHNFCKSLDTAIDGKISNGEGRFRTTVASNYSDCAYDTKIKLDHF